VQQLGQLVRVALDRVTDHPVTFPWEAPGLAASGRATIHPGSDHVDLTVTVPGDAFDNENHTHFLRLTGIDGAQLGATGGTTEIWIVDDDPPPSVSLAPGLASEHDGYVSVPVRVTQPSHRFIELAYRTRSRSAVDGRDFVGGTGVVSVKSYDGEGTIDIPIVDDATREGPERFVVELTEVRRAELGRRRAVVWIGDDD